tara:strand:+ start:702 stop:902 length:201 start_codon:yes stop_codon:yes gene_type:complete
MRIGSLVKKRYGKIEPFQAGTLGVVVGEFSTFTGQFIIVTYPDKVANLAKGVAYKADEFEVISEGR